MLCASVAGALAHATRVMSYQFILPVASYLDYEHLRNMSWASGSGSRHCLPQHPKHLWCT